MYANGETDLHSSYGDNEEMLGNWFKRTGLRHKIFLSTKFGFASRTDHTKFDSSAKYCKEACEKSLETLGTDYIDLCKHFHR